MITEIIDQIVESGQSLDDHIAVHDASGGAVSYSSLSDLIRSTTCGLIEEGLKVGDPVLLASGPGIDTLVLAISIVRAGGQLVPFSPFGGESLVYARLSALKPKCIVANSTILLASRIGLIRRILGSRGLSLPNLTSLPDCTFIRVGRRWPGVPSSISHNRLRISGRNTPLPDVPADNHSIAVFTSGTASDPKAVLHTNRSSGESVRISTALLDLSPSDIVFTDTLHSILPALVSGATSYIAPRSSRSPEEWIESVRQSGATVLFTTPAQMQEALEHLRRVNGSFPGSVQKIIIGSAPVHPALLRHLRSAVGPNVTVVSVYAMTEILPVAFVSAARKLDYSGEGDLVGTLVPDVEARLADDGELILSGPHLFDGYLNDEQVRDHETGDVARFLPSGELVLMGRKKDMIIRRGENVYPSLYEPTISSIPGVRRCAMIGYPDPGKQDESIILAVEPDPGVSADGIQKRVAREIVAGPFSIDRHAHPDVIVSTSIPVSGRSNKIDREKLKARLERMLPCGSRSPAQPGS